MNKRNMNTLANRLEKEEFPKGIDGFCMRWWCERRPSCGTLACIGGIADTLFKKAGVDALGLDEYQADALFFGEWGPFGDNIPFNAEPLKDATAQQGAQAVRNMIEDPAGDPWRHMRKPSKKWLKYNT